MCAVKAVVTDIEGTTSDIYFVHRVLFPYSKEHLPEFVRVHWDDSDIKPYLRQIAEAAGGESQQQVLEQLFDWVDRDVKETALKVLQGKIWLDAFRAGVFKSHIYPDAYEAIQGWAASGVPVYIYSSGSVDAQIGIFGHTELGDLSGSLRGYFDTEVGAKRESAAYQTISERIATPASDVLFLSDVVAELDAARSAGMLTCLLIREARPTDAGEHPEVRSFKQLDQHFQFST